MRDSVTPQAALIANFPRQPVEVREAAGHRADIDSGGSRFGDRHVGTVFILQRELLEERAGEQQFAAIDLLLADDSIIGGPSPTSP